jgi:hypothetical protein
LRLKESADYADISSGRHGLPAATEVVDMRVNPNSDTSTVAAIADGSAAKAPNLGRDTVTLTSADELGKALLQTPEVRSEKVAQATALVQDASYPPQVLIQKLSALFAGKLHDGTPKAASGQPQAENQTAAG